MSIIMSVTHNALATVIEYEPHGHLFTFWPMLESREKGGSSSFFLSFRVFVDYQKHIEIISSGILSIRFIAFDVRMRNYRRAFRAIGLREMTVWIHSIFSPK